MANNRLPNQALWLDAAITSMNVTALAYEGQLGAILEKDGCVYQVVKVKSTSSAITAGIPVCWSDFDDFTVSAEIDDIKRNYAAGLAVGTITAGSYGFIQVAGPYSAAISDGLVAAAGDALFMSATDGQLTKLAAGTAPTYITFGVATATSGGAVATLASGTVAMYLNCPRNY